MQAMDYVRRLRQHIGHELIQIASAAVILLDEQDRVLMVRHAHQGLWTPPGGMADLLESPADTAVRETWEETGLYVALSGVLGVFGGPHCRSTYANGDEAAWVATLFAGRIVSGTPHPDGEETTELRWWRRHDIRPELCLAHVPDFLRVAWSPPSSAWFEPASWQPPQAGSIRQA